MLSGSSRAADEGGRDIDARILPYVFCNNTLQLVYDYISLMEGWDAITVTHVRGVGAFGTQLLCEQVIGGALLQSCSVGRR